MSQETPVKEDKRKGKKGPRSLYFVCAAIKKDELIHELIQNADKDQAIAQFKEKNKVNPSLVEGPVYLFKGGAQAGASDPKFTVQIKPRDIATTGNRWEGILKGWNVVANGLKGTSGYKNDELVMIFPDSPVEKDTPKIRFGAGQKIVRRSELEQSKPLS